MMMDAFRKTKIIATLGPSSSSEEMIGRLMKAGVNVFRLNFSHGDHETHRKNAFLIRKLEQELQMHVAIMMDLQGPKIRIGTFEDGSANLKKGAKFQLDLNKEYGNSKRVMLPHPEILAALKVGTEVLLDDGKIKLRVEENTGTEVITEVLVDGIISNKKGLNIPNVILPITALTEKDKRDVELAEEITADWIAISFVQTAEDIRYARNFFSENIGVIAKIEKPSAVDHIDSILEVSDGVMVARGDLGVEMPYESIPGIQRMIINKARYHHKPVIVATQMLESMINCPVPTRAEISDVSCAVAEGADAVMLSAETASGKFPEEAALAMAKIAHRTELDQIDFFDSKYSNLTSIAESLAKTVKIEKINTIATFTETGRCAINVSNSRSNADIFAFTPDIKTARKLALVWGIKSILVDDIFSFSQMTQLVESELSERCQFQDNEKVAIIAGLPFRSPGHTNFMYVYDIKAKSETSAEEGE